MSLYGSIYRKALWPVYEWARGRQTATLFRAAEVRQWWSAEQLRDWQWQELVKLIQHAYASTQWYRKTFDSLGIKPADVRTIDDYRKLPLLTKTIIRNQREELVAKEFLSPVFRQSTGGSTGTPLEFLFDRNSYDWRQSIRMRAYGWAGALDGDRSLHLWGAPLSAQPLSSRIKTSLYNRILGRRFLNTYSLTDRDITAYLKIIRTARPVAIVGYTSSLVQIAQAINSRTITLPPIRSIIATAETLYELQRRLIEQAFGAPVYNSYGSREFMNIAMECECRQGLHLQVDNLLVECLKNGQPVSGAESGELVITDLHNYAMPFLRYQIEDMAVVSNSTCPCGRGLPMLERVLGRAFDPIVTPSGQVLSCLLFTGLLLDRYRAIQQLRVVQLTATTVELVVVVANDQCEKAEALRREVQSITGPSMTVSLRRVNEIPPDPSGKRRITESRVRSTAITRPK